MKWYRIENKGPEKAEVWIYEEIGDDFWTGGGVTAKSFQKELSAIKAPHIDLHINSPGGSVQDGIGIYNQIKRHPAHVTTYIDGWACSIASIVALAGDEIRMAANGIFMLHNPMGRTQGYAKDHRETADILDKLAGTFISTYALKTKKTDEEVLALMDGENGEGSWLNADEAFEHGFIDEIYEEMDLAACANFVPVMVKAGFKNIPKEITAKRDLNERDLEKALRDAGYSRTQAKEVVAKWRGDPVVRDAQPEPLELPLRDAEPAKPKDEVAYLLTQAELVAPSRA